MLAMGLGLIVRSDRHRQYAGRSARLDHDQRLGEVEDEVRKLAVWPLGQLLKHVHMIESDQAQGRDREGLVQVERRQAGNQLPQGGEGGGCALANFLVGNVASLEP